MLGLERKGFGCFVVVGLVWGLVLVWFGVVFFFFFFLFQLWLKNLTEHRGYKIQLLVSTVAPLTISISAPSKSTTKAPLQEIQPAISPVAVAVAVFVFPDRIPLCSHDILSVHQACLKLRDLGASSSQVLGLKALPPSSWLGQKIFFKKLSILKASFHDRIL